MADPFDITTPSQRRIVLAALAVYAVLFVLEIATGNPLAAAAADLLLAVLVIPASALVVRRATGGRTTDTVAVAAAVAFFVAGVTIGYEGLATLELVPRLATVEMVGTLALLAAFVLYLVHRR